MTNKRLKISAYVYDNNGSCVRCLNNGMVKAFHHRTATNSDLNAVLRTIEYKEAEIKKLWRWIKKAKRLRGDKNI